MLQPLFDIHQVVLPVLRSIETDWQTKLKTHEVPDCAQTLWDAHFVPDRMLICLIKVRLVTEKEELQRIDGRVHHLQDSRVEAVVKERERGLNNT
jgi:hypothetical protein